MSTAAEDQARWNCVGVFRCSFRERKRQREQSYLFYIINRNEPVRLLISTCALIVRDLDTGRALTRKSLSCEARREKKRYLVMRGARLRADILALSNNLSSVLLCLPPSLMKGTNKTSLINSPARGRPRGKWRERECRLARAYRLLPFV